MTDMDQLDTLRAAADAKYAKIRNDSTTTYEAKRSALARTLVDLKSKIAKIKADSESAVYGRENALAKKLYGIPNPSDASASISYRDAQDRARKIDIESEAVALYQRSQNAGDDLLARAILEWGFANLWIDVINAYVDANPANESAAQELWDITAGRFALQLKPLAALVTDFGYLTTPPPELFALNDYQLEQLALGPAANTLT